MTWDGNNFLIRLPKQIADMVDLKRNNKNKMIIHLKPIKEGEEVKLDCKIKKS